MRTAFSLVVVTFAASFLMSSCTPPEPTPRNILVGMTKEQVLKKFGSPDLRYPSREVLVPELMPTPGPDAGLLERLAYDGLGGVMEKAVTEPEQFRYFNQDGSLVTIVRFSEDGKVTDARRVPVADNR